MTSPRSHQRIVIGVLVIAAAVRVWGLGFGMPFVNARPDETQIAGPAVGYLSGDLRPPYLEWPSLFAYTVALLYVAYFVVTRPFASYVTLAAFAESRRVDIRPFIYITRGLSALMGVLTVWWLYALGKRAFDATVGLVAALFLALAFLHVRDSHFGVTDVAMTALVVLAVLAAQCWKDEGGARRAAWAGVAAGLAASAKYNGAIVCVAFAVALFQRLTGTREAFADRLRAAARDAIVFAACAAAAFFASSPYVAIDWSRFIARAAATQSMLEHGHGVVLGRGWWYFASVVLPAAVGWPMFVAAIAGSVLLLVTRLRQSAVVLAFPIAYYIVAGRGYGVFARYIVPMIPFLCLAAAWAVVEGARRLTPSRGPAVQRMATAVVALLVVAPSAYKTILLDRLLATEDNRAIAGRALVSIIPPGSTLYQTGEPYGHVPLVFPGARVQASTTAYDHVKDVFRPETPSYILVQRSPLVVYSWTPPSLDALLRDRYVLVRRFPVERRADVNRVYDQQDAFYIPLAGLEGLIRPGPAFDLYARRPE